MDDQPFSALSLRLNFHIPIFGSSNHFQVALKEQEEYWEDSVRESVGNKDEQEMSKHTRTFGRLEVINMFGCCGTEGKKFLRFFPAPKLHTMLPISLNQP